MTTATSCQSMPPSFLPNAQRIAHLKTLRRRSLCSLRRSWRNCSTTPTLDAWPRLVRKLVPHPPIPNICTDGNVSFPTSPCWAIAGAAHWSVGLSPVSAHAEGLFFVDQEVWSARCFPIRAPCTNNHKAELLSMSFSLWLQGPILLLQTVILSSTKCSSSLA